MFTSQMRFTGFSGIDTESMVRQIMNAESMRMHRFQRTRQMNVWRQEDYRGIRASLQQFQNRFLDVAQTGPNSNSLLTTAVTQANRVNVIGQNGVTGLNVTASSQAPQGTFNIRVDDTLRAGSVTGNRLDSAITAEYSMDMDFLRQEEASIRISLNGATAREINLSDIANSTSTEAEFVSALQQELQNQFGVTNQGDPRVTVGLVDGRISFNTELASDTIIITQGEPGTLMGIGGITSGARNNVMPNSSVANFLGNNFNFTDGVGQITLNGQSIDIQENWSIQQTVNAINNSDAGVTVAFNATTQAFTFTNRQAGAGSDITFGTDANSEALQNAFLGDTVSNLAANSPSQVIAGRNAQITVTDPNGHTFSLEQSNSNAFVFDGLNVNVAGAASGAEFNVEIARDTDRLRGVIVNFVYEYNELVRELAELRQTARPTGASGAVFDPRLPHEGEGLTEHELRLWDEQSRQGMLHRSREIERTLGDMRRVASEGVQVGDRTIFLHDFGISHNLSRTPEHGTIHIMELDESGLDTALSDFSSGEVHTFFSQMGFALSTTMNEAVRRIEEHAGGTNLANLNNRLQNEINDLDARIATMEERLARREAELFAQFGRMEAAIMQANSQMDFLFMMMG